MGLFHWFVMVILEYCQLDIIVCSVRGLYHKYCVRRENQSFFVSTVNFISFRQIKHSYASKYNMLALILKSGGPPSPH